MLMQVPGISKEVKNRARVLFERLTPHKWLLTGELGIGPVTAAAVPNERILPSIEMLIQNNFVDLDQFKKIVS